MCACTHAHSTQRSAAFTDACRCSFVLRMQSSVRLFPRYNHVYELRSNLCAIPAVLDEKHCSAFRPRAVDLTHADHLRDVNFHAVVEFIRSSLVRQPQVTRLLTNLSGKKLAWITSLGIGAVGYSLFAIPIRTGNFVQALSICSVIGILQRTATALCVLMPKAHRVHT
jgi:hypothetical protein